jgi:YhcH/YjgK/YiaL family protein
MNNNKKKHENWIAGLPVKPQPSVNTATLEKQLNLAPERWSQAFNLLKTCGFSNLDPGRYEIDGLNLFFMVNHYETKPSEEVLFEAHREYADIQYVYEGEEFIGVAPLEAGKETVAYNPEKDIAFYEVKEAVSHKAAADRIFILFPEDLHQPGVMTDMAKPVKKVVIKVKLERD